MLDLPLGPAMIDVAGLALTQEERERLAHPLVGAVILFKRNYASPDQLEALTAEIHAIRTPPLLIAVDQEGGRVQRFHERFTRLPPMRAIGRVHESNPELARNLARATGIVIASELVDCGVDFSFTPVLDLDYGRCSAIGDRAFHRDPAVVAELAGALVEGLRILGVAAVGKHFPGHGHVEADSHTDVPVDDREFEEIEAADLAPYRALIPRGLAGVMPAHVIYRRVDPHPAGFSAFWIGEVLRKRLGFRGIVFSDDLSMEGASVAGDVVSRAHAALAAGCDMVLVCNAPEQAAKVLDGLRAVTLDARLGESMRARRAGSTSDYVRSRDLLAQALAAGC